MIVSLLLLSALAAEPAEADDDARALAAQRYEAGARLYDEGNYEASVAAFASALELSGETSLHFNIANAWERAGRLQDARDALAAYRDVAPAEEHTTLDLRLASMQRRIDAAVLEPEPEPPAPAPVLPEPHPRWALVGAGVGVAAGSVALAGITYGGAQSAYAELDRTAYDRQRTLNGVSWAGVGVGAGLAVAGLAFRTNGAVSVSPRGLGLRF